MNIKKEYFRKDGKGKKIWELQDVEAVFKYNMYLSSHVTQLNNCGKKHVKINVPFGDLYNKKPLDLVTEGRLQQIQESVLELINKNREQKFAIVNGKLNYAVPEETKDEVVPISHFRYDALNGREFTKNFIENIRLSNPDNAAYLTYLIETYNDVWASKVIPFTFRRLFITPFDCDVNDMPSFVQWLPDGLAKRMFTEGLKAPPMTFKFCFNNHLSESELQVKDKFELYCTLNSDKGVKVEQIVKPVIKLDDPAYIASVEKRFKKLCSESVNYA